VVFLRSRCYVASELRGSTASFEAADHDTSADARVEEILRGVVLPVFGGDLYGWYRIGADQADGWTTPDGVPVARIAEHDTAQCALVMALDGRIGVSWSGEFLPRYSHLNHLVEATAMWASFLDWEYADALRCNAGQVVSALAGSDLVPEASGEYVRWWRAADHAVYAEPRLTEANASVVNVSVLARTKEKAMTIRRVLRSEVSVDRPEVCLAAGNPIGHALPDVPSMWGPIESGAALLGGVS
jgi:hypothetical protein